MARVGAEVDLVPSILDRLLDDAPENQQQEPPATRFQRVRQLKQAVARDLEALLNTRQESLEDIPPEWTELRSSLLVYGLPDFTSLSLLNPDHKRYIRQALVQAIERFEPRLTQVRVEVEDPKSTDRGLHFHIEGLLQVRPAPELVSFDGVIQLGSRACVIEDQS